MTTRNLLSGPITFSSATARSANVLHALQYPLRKLAFYSYIEGHRALLAEVIAHHLGTKPTDIEIAPQEWWQHGSFNLVIPLNVNVDPAHSSVPHAILRFPLPYRVGEVANPGNSDEKLNCEAATYAWLEANCPSVPIPKLYGFGLSTNQRVSTLAFESSSPSLIIPLVHECQPPSLVVALVPRSTTPFSSGFWPPATFTICPSRFEPIRSP